MAKRKRSKLCERCPEQAILGQRFCKDCKKEVLAELRDVGYLETGGYGRRGQSRTTEMKEKTNETKFGTAHG